MLPIDPPTLGAFAVAATALVISPGPDTMIILRYTMTSGRRVGLATVAGVQMGLVVHTLLAVLGISYVIASSPVLFKLVTVAGAGYLGWLGIQGFLGTGAMSLGAGGPGVGMAKAWRDAILCNILNPKVILLFLALFPNFIDAGRDDVPAQLTTLAVTLILINILWQTPLAWTADAIRRWIGRPSVHRAVSRSTGGVLLIFAALMLYDNLLR